MCMLPSFTFVRGYKEVNDNWLQNIWTEHEESLIRYATFMLQDSNKARDVVQDVFVKLSRQDPVKIRCRVRQWLYVTTRNRIRELKRKNKKIAIQDTSDFESQEANISNPLITLMEEEERNQVIQELKQLSHREQEVIRLKFQSGLSYCEIGEVLEISTSHVGVIMHFAFKKLRKKFEVLT